MTQNDNSEFEPGKLVCVSTAQDRKGVLVRVVQDSPRNRRWLVQFPNALQRLPERSLKLLQENQTVDELIQAGAYGKPRHLRGAITHSRLTGRLADVIYSMEATNTEFFSYQFKPVLNFLESPSNGILIADEVGLGKTIEAGLIWTELRARMDANRLLVICPAVLREKWRSELLHRFGIKAEICSASELLEKLKDRETKQQEELAVIASFQGLRPPKNWEDDDLRTGAAELARYISDSGATDSLFDCVIIDEAHYLRNPESQTHKLAHLIRPVSGNVVLLSATPIQLRSDDLFHLLNIIDNENFEFKQAFDGVLEANRPLVSLADKLRRGGCSVEKFLELVEMCMDNPMLVDNYQLQDMRDNPPTKEQLSSIDSAYRIRLANRVERINLLARVISRSRKRDVNTNKVIRVPEAPIIDMNDVEKAFYDAVTEEVRIYCEEYDLFEGFLLTIPQRQMCSSMPAALRAWLKKRQVFDGEIVFETGGDDFDTSSASSKKVSTESKSGPLIERLSSLAASVGNYDELKQNDSKYSELVRLLQNYWKENPGQKIILFSYYRETLTYLLERLTEDGTEAALIMGGMGQQKEEIIEQFKQESGPNILLASEVLSEGVDLQFSSALINYDLPWNPMRVEQRIGRIDRIGQEKDRILIWNFFYQDTLDDRVYTRLFNRLEIFTEALGDMEAVLGERIRGLTYELLSHKLSKSEEIERIEQTASAIEQQRQQQERLEEDAVQLQAHGDYVLNRVSAAKEMQRFIHGDDLWSYIRDFLDEKFHGSNLTITEDSPLTADIELSLQAKSELQMYVEKNRSLTRSGLATAATGLPVKCVFNNRVDFGDKKYEVINQYHPLVRFVADSVSIEDFHPVVAVAVKKIDAGTCTDRQYVFIAKRWSTRGAKTQEKLVYRALSLSSEEPLSDEAAERLVNAAVSVGEDWLNAVASVDNRKVMNAYEHLENCLDDEFDEYCKYMQMENEDQVNFRIRTLKGQIARQIESRREAIEKLKAKGKDRLVPANLGQIAKLEAKRDQQIEVFKRQREISSEPQDVIVGVVNVV